MATIVIPAHNEATVIGRTLTALCDTTTPDDAPAQGLRPGTRVVVAANGCTDDTVAIARSFADRLELEVLELAVASKQAALNGADEHLAGLDEQLAYPRVYLDADIAAPVSSVNAVLDALDAGALAARPPLEYQTLTADPLVKAYYRARTRTPEVMTGLWGAGFYAVSAEGRRRWGRFPDHAPDDLFVDSLFTAEEKILVDAAPVPVEVPRSTTALLQTLKRVHRPAPEVDADHGSVQAAGGTLKALLHANSGDWATRRDAAAYVAMALGARLALAAEKLPGRPRKATWERDDSTR